MEQRFDIVIVGSGLGGLECGIILSREGYNVCVVEKSHIFGGCLQSFTRGGYHIDTGIHYVGSMGQGQIMRQYLKYFGILDSLAMVELDRNFDTITLGDCGTYRYMQGYSDFVDELSVSFPSQRAGLEKYCKTIREIGASINVDVHKSGKFTSMQNDSLNISAVDFIEQCVDDPILRNVLAGTFLLCGSTRQTANLYHHAMINHSNIEGAYRFVGGSQQLADLLVEQIRNNGGTLIDKARVVSFEMNGDSVGAVVLEDGRKIFADKFISNLHPASTFSMLENTPLIKKAYRTRLSLLSNTYGLFSVYLCMKKDSFPYLNKNLYFHNSSDVWDLDLGSKFTPKSLMMSCQQSQMGSRYSDVVTLIMPINHEIFMPYENSQFGSRPEGYLYLKKQLEQRMIEFASLHYPSLMDSVEKIYSSTPLTYKHYTGTPQGSAYGIIKSYKNSLTTLIPARTKIKNLYLTGQNLNVHGAVGVTLTAASTCSEILGVEYLAKKIGDL